jgi:hypothetical protein
MGERVHKEDGKGEVGAFVLLERGFALVAPGDEAAQVRSQHGLTVGDALASFDHVVGDRPSHGTQGDQLTGRDHRSGFNGGRPGRYSSVDESDHVIFGQTGRRGPNLIWREAVFSEEARGDGGGFRRWRRRCWR